MNRRLEDNQVWFYLGWVLVLVLAAWLRLGNFDRLILLDDEWHALHAQLRLSYAGLFQTFGHADHSIPIALWLKWLADLIGLNEWRIGLPFLLAGVLAVWLVPRSFRSYLKPDEQFILAVLLAVSPLLIYYSQQARPYALLVVLMPLAIVALWRYRLGGDKRLALAFIACGVVCSWLHPLMLVWLCWALLIAACFSLLDWIKGKGGQGLLRMVVTGLVMLTLSSLLLIWPMMNDLASLQIKTGTHQVQPESFWIAWQFFLGNGSHWVAGIALLITCWGLAMLFKRDRWFSAYWVLLSLGSLVMISATDAAWLNHGLVLARYSVPLQLFMLALLALGFYDVLARLNRPALTGVLGSVLVIVLIYTGPTRDIQRQPNAWAKHLYYQFDYRFERSLYRLHLDPIEVPAAYEEIARDPEPGRVFEAGWWFESHYNPLVLYQRAHRREMKIVMLRGSCMDWAYGELPDDALDPTRDHVRFRMKNFVHLSELNQIARPGDFLVFHQQIPLEEYRERPDHAECIALAETMFGSPWFEDERTLVFRKPPQV